MLEAFILEHVGWLLFACGPGLYLMLLGIVYIVGQLNKSAERKRRATLARLWWT